MSRDSDFSRLFDALGVEPGCSWEEARRAYRRQAQSWHPDRFPESSPERAEAEKKFKRINRAYQILAAYWKQFGELPGQNRQGPTAADASRTARKDATATGSPTPGAQSTPAPARPASRAGTPASHSRYRGASLIVLVFLCVAVFGLLYQEPRNVPTDGPRAGSSRTGPAAPAQTAPPETLRLPRDDKIQPFFTIGSSMNKVHEIQGIPSRIEGDTWFFGTSKVHFADGLVADWASSPSNPLYAMETPDSTGNKLILTKRRAKIVKGATKSEVLAIQGKPLFQSEHLWEYRISKVFFENGKVVGWRNSPLDPLKVNGE